MSLQPWAAPDAPAEPQPVRPAVIDPVRGSRPGRGASRAPGVPVPLRPMSVADLLDGSLRIVKLAPQKVLGLAALFVVPGQLVIAALTHDRLGDASTAGAFQLLFQADGETGDSTYDLFSLALVLQQLALACVCVGLADLVSAWYRGQDRTLAEILGGIGRRAWVLVAAWVLVHVVELAFSLLLVVPVVLPFTWFAVVSPVVACEGRNPWRSVGRSFALTRRRFGSVLGAGLLVVVVDVLLNVGLGAIGSAYEGFDLPAGWIVATLVSMATLLITVPFVAGVATLLYVDLRVRTEGLDIQLATSRRFGAA